MSQMFRCLLFATGEKSFRLLEGIGIPGNETDIMEFSIAMDNFAVSNFTLQYACTLFQLPNVSSKHHI